MNNKSIEVFSTPPTNITEISTTTKKTRTRYRPGSRPNRYHQGLRTQGLRTTTRWAPNFTVRPVLVLNSKGLKTSTRWRPNTTAQPKTKSTKTNNKSTEVDSTPLRESNIYSNDSITTTPVRSKTRYRVGSRPSRYRPTLRPRRTTTTIRRKPLTTVQPTMTSTTTLIPITTSTAQPSIVLTTHNTPLLTTQMSTTSTEVASTLPTEDTEPTTFLPAEITESNPLKETNIYRNDKITTTTVRSKTRYRVGSRPSRYRPTLRPRRTTTTIRRKPLTTVQPTTTSTTTLIPITTSTAQPAIILTTHKTPLPTTEMSTTSTEVASTLPTEYTEPTTFLPAEITESETSDTNEHPTFMTTTPLQITLNQTIAYNADSLTTTTTRSTTTTASLPTTEAFIQEIQTTEAFIQEIQTTEAFIQEIQTTEEAGHPGEVFLVDEGDIPNLKVPKPLKPSIPKPVLVGSGLTVGVGLNIADPEEGLERLGPVLIVGNNLRRRRQHQGENSFTDETEGPATDAPVETTINPFNDGIEDNDFHTDFETTLGPISFIRRTSSTAPPTISDASSQSIIVASDATIGVKLETENDVLGDPAINIISSSDFQEITVGTKVNLGGHKKTIATGEVIPVELENKSQFQKEHKSEVGIELNSESEGDQTISVSARPERPDTSSILGSLFNYFTQSRPERPERPHPDRPRPDRPTILRPEIPPVRPGEKIEFRPFRPRPRPAGSRPDILPPRLSLRPSAAEPISDFTTNKPVDTTIVLEDSPADELLTRSTQPPVRVSNFRPRPTGLLNKPSRPRPAGLLNKPILPSKPIIESGFQGIRGEQGDPRPAGLFRPGAEELNDYEYDADALPPSLPNLKIIPFVAADALTNQQGDNIDSFAGDDFRISLQEPVTTTSTSTTVEPTSTRRPPFVPGTRRPPILPLRRPLRPDGTGRPSPFRQRPGRPGSRPPFIPARTTPRDRITSEENSIAPSTTPSATRLRFTTTRKPITTFTLVPVEKTTKTVKPVQPEVVEPEIEITTDDLPISIESNTVNTPEAPLSPLRLPGPIRPIITSSQSSSSSSSSSKPIKTDDISNLFLQDIFGQPEGTNRPPVRFIPASNKPIAPIKTRNPLPEIPSIITNLFPLAPDPIVAQGLLKLSGCNIYGRMYELDDRINELSAECKECRCTPVGVQCLPVCA